MYYEALKPVCFLRFIWISSISYHMFFLHNITQLEREKPHLFFFSPANVTVKPVSHSACGLW